MKSLLAAVDFSEDSRRSAWRAATIAVELGARLELLHMVSADSMATLRELLRPHAGAAANIKAQARQQLDEMAGEILRRTGIDAKVRVKVGDVLEGILEASGQAGLLVLGARGWNPLRDMILGTTAERLLGRCRQPVLVARRPVNGTYRRAVVAVDFSAHSMAALDMALHIAPGAEITLVHAFVVPFEGKLRLAGVEDARLREHRAEARHAALAQVIALAKQSRGGSRLSHAVAYGNAPRLILDKAQQMRADLIVIGKHGKSAVEELFLGSVTRHVLSDARCDVLVVQEAHTRK